MKTLTVRATIEVPRVPNYLIIDEHNKLSIADIQPGELRRIGELWTEKLIERACRVAGPPQGRGRDRWHIAD